MADCRRPTLAAATLATAAALCLAAAGWLEPRLAAPPLAAPASMSGWWARTGPAVGTVAFLRLAGIAAGAYLDLALLAASVARLTRRRRLQHWSTLLLPRPARSLLAVAAGICTVAQPVAASASTPVGPSPVASPYTGAAPPSQVRIDPPPLLTPAGPPSSVPSPTPHLPVRGGRVPAGRPRRTERPAGPAPEWTVQPGESFWTIAEAVVASRSVIDRTTSLDGRDAGAARIPPAPDPATVARYWTSLVAANLDRLPVPGNPDILYVGDRVLLPPLGALPAGHGSDH